GIAVSGPRYVLGRDANREDLASLLASAAECFAPPLRSHACAETMSANALLVTRAVGGLAHKCSKPGSEIFGYRTGKCSAEGAVGQEALEVLGVRSRFRGFVVFLRVSGSSRSGTRPSTQDPDPPP